MTEPNLQTDECLELSERTNIAYGAKSLIINFPEMQSNSKVWDMCSNLFLPPSSTKLEKGKNFPTTAFINKESQETSDANRFQIKMAPFTQENLLENEEDEIQNTIYLLSITTLSICNPTLLMLRSKHGQKSVGGSKSTVRSVS